MKKLFIKASSQIQDNFALEILSTRASVSELTHISSLLKYLIQCYLGHTTLTNEIKHVYIDDNLIPDFRDENELKAEL